MIRAIQILGERKILGRTILARLLNTGSGAVRTLIKDLEEQKVIIVERNGCRLTAKGLTLYQQISTKIPLVTQIDAGILSVDKFNAAALVKDSSDIIRRGIEQRDAAIRIGAAGATTLVYRNGRFAIPMGSEDCARDFPGGVWRGLKEKFHPEDGDVIVVSSAADTTVAVYGSLAAALTLLEASEGGV